MKNMENWSETFGWYLWKRWENCFSCMKGKSLLCILCIFAHKPPSCALYFWKQRHGPNCLKRESTFITEICLILAPKWEKVGSVKHIEKARICFRLSLPREIMHKDPHPSSLFTLDRRSTLCSKWGQEQTPFLQLQHWFSFYSYSLELGSYRDYILLNPKACHCQNDRFGQEKTQEMHCMGMFWKLCWKKSCHCHASATCYFIIF